MGGFLRARGYWDQAAALHQTALAAARQAGDRAGQARRAPRTGRDGSADRGLPAAAASLAQAVALYGRHRRPARPGRRLCQLGIVQRWTGDYSGRHRQPPSRRLRWPAALMTGAAKLAPSNILSAAQQMTGDYLAAAVNLPQALELYRRPR